MRYVMPLWMLVLCLLPLALTSTKGWIRRLGGKRWQRLHRLVYFSAVGGVLHYAWLVKADLREPVLYAAILGLLLGYRLWHALRQPATVRRIIKVFPV